MTRDVRSVRPDTTLKQVAAILAEHRISGVPVVDADLSVAGVVTKADILAKEAAEPPSGLRRLLHRREANVLESKIEARTAGEAMSAPAITVEPLYTTAEAARLMIEHGVNRLPVLERGKLAGIITRFDLVCAFARSDRELEREIREDALRGMIWSDDLVLTVTEGDVTLRGDVDSSFDAEALPAMIRRIPGVVSVDSQLDCFKPGGNEKVSVAVRL
jgi:CBS domain-containing protein